MIRVPRRTGLPDILPGTFSISSQAIQSISETISAGNFATALIYSTAYSAKLVKYIG